MCTTYNKSDRPHNGKTLSKSKVLLILVTIIYRHRRLEYHSRRRRRCIYTWCVCCRDFYYNSHYLVILDHSFFMWLCVYVCLFIHFFLLSCRILTVLRVRGKGDESEINGINIKKRNWISFPRQKSIHSVFFSPSPSLLIYYFIVHSSCKLWLQLQRLCLLLVSIKWQSWMICMTKL